MVRRMVARLERTVAVLLAATIVAVAMGSSWSERVMSAGSPLRWAALLALTAAAVGLAYTLAPVQPLTVHERRGAVLACVFLGLCVLSVGWSVDPRLTIERAATVVAVFATAGALAFAGDRRAGLVDLVAQAVLAAIAILLLVSLVVVVVDPTGAVQTSGERFRGIGGNPDNLPLLMAYALPLAAWRYLDTTRRLERAACAAIAAGVLVLIGAAGSRGGLVAGAAGMLVFVASELARRPLRAVAIGVAVVVVLGATLLITPLVSHIPGVVQPAASVAVAASPAPASSNGQRTVAGSPPAASASASTTPSSASAPSASASAGTTGSAPAKAAPSGSSAPATPAAQPKPVVTQLSKYDPLTMYNELGRPISDSNAPAGHNLFGSSGRLQAWQGAIRQGNQRPLLGYGFGTEDHVFIDRWYFYDSARAENSLIGLYMMLGLAGLASLCVLLGWVGVAGWKTLRHPPERRRAVAALAGIVVAGLVEMMVQTYAFSAGDIAMLTFWICAALVAVSPQWASEKVPA
jgi:O-antigen ligase